MQTLQKQRKGQNPIKAAQERNVSVVGTKGLMKMTVNQEVDDEPLVKNHYHKITFVTITETVISGIIFSCTEIMKMEK
jgi:hypothetical protein